MLRRLLPSRSTRVLELTRDGRTSEARQVQTSELAPLADRLERLTNQLVNRAEADMVSGVDASRAAYETSRVYVAADQAKIFEGYSTTGACDRVEALEVARRDAPDLILL